LAGEGGSNPPSPAILDAARTYFEKRLFLDLKDL